MIEIKWEFWVGIVILLWLTIWFIVEYIKFRR